MKNIPVKRDYHHGDLRNALIEGGLRLLAKKASGDIGLREAAREAGVSPTAVYRHFPDKNALLAALAAEGYERLADAQQAAANKKNKLEGFRASGQAYVRFALANPALFRLMSSYMNEASDKLPRSDSRSAEMLRENIAAIMPPDAGRQTRDVAAAQAWALVHGLAVLVLSGQLPNDPDFIDAIVDDFGFR